jgi:Ca-activated chloride channel family protein
MANKAPLAAAVVVGIVAIVGIKAVTATGGIGSGSPSAPGTDTTMAATPRAGCTTVTVAASSEKAALLSQLAASYNKSGRTVDGKCFGMRVTTAASGTAETALAHGWSSRTDGTRPDVWTPASSTWVGLLRQDLTTHDRPDVAPTTTPSITSTPLVLAMPKPMATALGWPNKQLGWGDVLSLANNPAGWGAKGHPEWGKFTLGKTNPNISTSGLEATVGAFVAATGRSSDLSLHDVADPKVRRYVADVEHSVVHYGDTTLTYLSNLQRADDNGTGLGYVSAVAVEEKSVLDYDAGNPTGDPKTLGDHRPPKVPLVAVYPKEGTLYSDSPWVTLNAPWVTDAKKAGAADMLNYLRSPAAQTVFTNAGFRTYNHKAPIKRSDDVQADGVKVTLSPPSPDVLARVRTTWSQVRKRARVLLLLDVSGSMGEEVPNAGGATKLDLAKKAALSALDDFAPTDQVGVWAFTTDMSGGHKTYAQLAPVAPIGGQRTKIKRVIQDLIPLDGTPLYAAIRAAASKMRSTADPDAINAVVVLTDGKNEYPQDTDLSGLVRDLGAGASEDGLRVFCIAYGDGADLGTLKKISQASNAAAYDATNPATISDVFTDVISNF